MPNRNNKIAEALGRDAMATSGRHNLRQTAFRLPAEQLEWLADEAERNDTTMTAIVITAINQLRLSQAYGFTEAPTVKGGKP